MRRKLVVALKLAVAGVLLAYLLRSGKLDLSKLSRIESWGWIALAQVAIFSMLSLTFLRWHLLLKAQGIDYALGETYSLGFIGFSFSQLVPGSTGGDLIKAYYVAIEHPERRLPGVMSVILDRLLGLFVLASICGVASVLAMRQVFADAELRWLAYAILVGLGIACAASLIFFNDRIRESPRLRRLLEHVPLRAHLVRIQDSIYVYKRRPAIVAVTVAMSVAVHLLLVLASICYARALGALPIPPSLFFFLVPLANLAMAVPITPGGLGVGEFASIELFRRAGYADGDVLAILHRLSFYSWALVGLVFYLFKKKRIRQALAASEGTGEPEEITGGTGGAPESAHSPPSRACS